MDALTIMNSAPSPKQLIKALEEAKNHSSMSVIDPKSAIIDPMNVLNFQGTRPKPSVIPMATLRRMASIPAISAIIRTRQNQVARFAKPPRFEGDTGFKIVLKDIEAKMTPADKKEAARLQDFLLKTGGVANRIRRDNMDRFMRKVVADTLTLDQMCWENVPDRKGNLAEMWALDAATIELVVQEPTSEAFQLPVYVPFTKKGMLIEGEIAYVQRVQGQIVAEYSEDEMCFATRNPYTDINLCPFGRSELEDLFEIVTAIVNGVRYNTSYFSSSNLPQGVLELVGKYSDETLEAFKRHWTIMTQGPGGKWKVPVMAMEDGQGFKFTEFKKSNRDMEFNEFLEFLFNIACAVFQIDPNEVGFKSWTSNKGGMGQSDNTTAKIEQSQDKGFVPLMTFLGNTIDSETIDRLNDAFCVSWIGVDTEAEEKRLERAKVRLEAGLSTPNMERARMDEEEIKAEWADAPANTVLMQVFMADKQAELQKQQADQQAELQKQQGQQQGQQQMDLADKTHGQNKEMAAMQHGQAKELTGMQQGFQGKESAMGRYHDENMADKTHGFNKELAGQGHGQNKDMEDKKHENAVNMQKMTHEQQKEMEQGKQGHDAVMAEKAHGQNKEMADKQHEQSKEMADKTHGQNKEMEQGKQGHDAVMSERQHGYAKDQNEQKNNHSKEADERQYKQQTEMADKTHGQNKEMADHQHGNAKDMADHQHEQNKEMVGAKKEAKKRAERQGDLFQKSLRKSISDIYLADNPLIERLAARVHTAWQRTGSSDDPDMVEYDQLHEAVKETDRCCARAVIEQLMADGLIPTEAALNKAIDKAKFSETEAGRVVEINPWDIY